MAAAATTPVAPSPKKGSPLLKIVAIVLGFLAFITVIGIGSCVYIGYRVERKAEQVAAQIKKETAQARGEPENVKTVPALPCSAVDPAQSQAFRAAAASASIPLKPGLTLVNLWTNESMGGREVEVLTTVQSIDDSTVTVQAARSQTGSPPSTRILCIADLMNARQYHPAFGTNDPTTIAGATMFTIPQVVFQDWQAARPAEFEYISTQNATEGRIRLTNELKGQVSRVEPNDVPYSIIINGDRKDVPAIHVKGQLGDKATEAFVLDDLANPITLKWEMPSWNYHINYVKINFPVEKKIEQDLAQTGRAEIYGIYFDFDSATLRPESDPVLKEISEALKNNPGWKIKIDGHTDNKGGDEYNLRLSQRRSESVMQALTTRYGITADRMTPEGFGASRPKAANDTVEGRALNRRVELVRE